MRTNSEKVGNLLRNLHSTRYYLSEYKILTYVYGEQHELSSCLQNHQCVSFDFCSREKCEFHDNVFNLKNSAVIISHALIGAIAEKVEILNIILSTYAWAFLAILNKCYIYIYIYTEKLDDMMLNVKRSR